MRRCFGRAAGILLGVVLGSVGCTSDGGPADAGGPVDAAVPADASLRPDMGGLGDAGFVEDAGPVPNRFEVVGGAATLRSPSFTVDVALGRPLDLRAATSTRGVRIEDATPVQP